MWLDAERSVPLLSVERETPVPPKTRHGREQAARYAVLDGDGTVLCRVSRVAGRFLGPSRASWTVGEEGQEAVATARKGSLPAWVLWWAVSPVNLPLALVSGAGGIPVLLPTPRGVRLTRGSDPVLSLGDWRASFTVEHDGVDLRAAAGFALLYWSLAGL